MELVFFDKRWTVPARPRERGAFGSSPGRATSTPGHPNLRAMTDAVRILQDVQNEVPGCWEVGLLNLDSRAWEASIPSRRSVLSGPNFIDWILNRFSAHEEPTPWFLRDIGHRRPSESSIREVMAGTPEYLALGVRLNSQEPRAIVLVLEPATPLGLAWALTRGIRSRASVEL